MAELLAEAILAARGSLRYDGERRNSIRSGKSNPGGRVGPPFSEWLDHSRLFVARETRYRCCCFVFAPGKGTSLCTRVVSLLFGERSSFRGSSAVKAVVASRPECRNRYIDNHRGGCKTTQLPLIEQSRTIDPRRSTSFRKRSYLSNFGSLGFFRERHLHEYFASTKTSRMVS